MNRKEEGGEVCDSQRFEVVQIGFSWKCFSTGCSFEPQHGTAKNGMNYFVFTLKSRKLSKEINGASS